MRSASCLLLALLALLTLPSIACAQMASDQQLINQLDQAHVSASEGAGITVAVIDSGLDSTWAGPRTEGTDFVAGGADMIDGGVTSKNMRHGTAVADMIHAYAPAATIMPIRIIGPENSATDERISLAIDYAVANGARVINLSIGGQGAPTQQLVDAVTRATTAGIILVCSAGNDGMAVSSPANIPGCIAVSATAIGGHLAPYSNRGPQIALAASGIAAGQTMNGSPVYVEGTSFAAPRVSAIAADLLAAGASREQAIHALLVTAWLVPSQRTNFGSGLVSHDGATHWIRTASCARQLRVRMRGVTRAFGACSPKLMSALALPRRTRLGGLAWVDAAGHLVYRAPVRIASPVLGDAVVIGRTVVPITFAARAAAVQSVRWPSLPAIMPAVSSSQGDPNVALPATPPDAPAPNIDGCDQVNESC